MKEDDVLMGLLENVRGDRRNIELEKQYNHYGDRGVVDVVVEDYADNAMWVVELKGDSAVNEATGANEIIRQFNRHREYFFEGVDKRYSAERNKRVFMLSFAATDRCWEHLKDNWPLYENLSSKHRVVVSLEHPDSAVSGYPFQESKIHDGWENQHVFAHKAECVASPEGIESPERVSD